MAVRVAVGRVEDALRDQRRAAVGRDVAQPDDEGDHLGVAVDAQRTSARAGRGSRAARSSGGPVKTAEYASSARWSAGSTCGDAGREHAEGGADRRVVRESVDGAVGSRAHPAASAPSAR